MTLKYNGTTIPGTGIIKYNGTSLGKVIYNGTTVWTKTAEALVPTLSSNTNVIYSGQYSTLYAYYVFDNNASTRWHQAGGGSLTTAYIGYNFNASKTVTKVQITNSYENEKSPSKFILQGSDNGTSWTNIQTFTNSDNTAGKTTSFTVTTPKTFKRFRLYMDKDNLNSFSNDPNGVSLTALQFYGY